MNGEKRVYIAGRPISPMCDCEEMEYEDFELMLVSLSKKLPATGVEAPVQAPLLQVVSPKNRK
jgi:hypothetical protein